jgi:hypothetical protein
VNRSDPLCHPATNAVTRPDRLPLVSGELRTREQAFAFTSEENRHLTRRCSTWFRARGPAEDVVDVGRLMTSLIKDAGLR